VSPLRSTVVQLVSAFVLIFLFTCNLFAATPVSCTSPSNAQAEPTEYFVSLADSANHLAHVSVRLREGSGARVLEMPVWNALYQVRNFAANIENVRAQDAAGAAVAIDNVKTSEWQITVPPGCLVVNYDIYLNSPGPFGTTLNEDHGFFNWAMVLMYSPAYRAEASSVRFLDVPTTWELRDVHVFGAAAPGKVDHAVGIARNYDELVDSPVEVGTFQQSSFQQDGGTYYVVVHGNPADYDMAKLDTVLKQITHAEVDWMQDRPFDEYTFLYHFPHGPAGGGMEHAYGTAIDVNADRLRGDLLPLAEVTAHEFFHLWNVKRIRPQSLEPINYQAEMDTRALWFSEGVTSTVGDLMMVRSGLFDERQYLAQISGEITELQRRPAHTWQSVEESSLDAWFEGIAAYRSPERSISYYNKGEIDGILLDLRIREVTNGTKSLRDLFHLMNDQYAKQHRFFPDSAGVEQAAESITGQSFGEFFGDYVAGVKEIPYDEFFQFVGLQVVPLTTRVATAGFTSAANLGGQPEVARVDPNSDAQRQGILPGDRVTAVNGAPAQAYLDEELSRLAPGTVIHLQLENRRGKREVELRLGVRQEQSYEVRDLPAVTAAQREHRAAWIHGEDEAGRTH
jgi:predicted metalloprotease with PDZ domain